MSKMKQEMETRCELALMGKVVPVNSNDEVQPMMEYILTVVDDVRDCSDFLENVINHYCENEVKYIVCNRIENSVCITFLLEYTGDDEEESYPAPLEESYGTGYQCAFCYVFNTKFEYCSEFGDCFFEKRADGYYHRVS